MDESLLWRKGMEDDSNRMISDGLVFRDFMFPQEKDLNSSSAVVRNRILSSYCRY